MYLISDNIDTLTGMRLAGVDGVVVHERNELRGAIENAMKNNPNMKNRHGIVHAQILNEDLIERIQKSNIIAYIQPIFLEYDLTIAESRVGKERIENSYAFRKMYDKGIKIPFGTDSPVEDFEMCIRDRVYSIAHTCGCNKHSRHRVCGVCQF